MGKNDQAKNERVRRLGRRAGIVVFAAIVVTFTVVCSTQILIQIWRTTPAPDGLACRQGVHKLIRALRRASAAAAAENGDDKAALSRFRAALTPEWTLRPGLLATCAGDKQGLQAIDEVDRLRYAEEHAVRYEAVDLAPRRRRVRAIEMALGHGSAGEEPALNGPNDGK